eukprot:TRINITY_DN93999_c0_g1_i1.p1 TRINITY_DN93999_c0_g1~~TRINITY_DN93999_c0_g1_i1.p1  ORF type:complete len:200 (-),score=14.58 TRINITY_DN93999_c0_g1_i1:116-715(-)
MKFWSDDREHDDDEETPLLSPSKELTFKERLTHAVHEFRLSRWYVVWCLLIAILCMALLAYSIFLQVDHRHSRHLWLLICEVFITLVIVLETAADLIIYGWRDYWKDWWRVFDFVICVICVIGLAVDIFHWYMYMEVDDYISTGLLIMRYVLQAVRAVRFLVHAHRSLDEIDAVDATSIALPSPDSKGTRWSAGSRSPT